MDRTIFIWDENEVYDNVESLDVTLFGEASATRKLMSLQSQINQRNRWLLLIYFYPKLSQFSHHVS